jgi:hypothetical protein
MTYKQAMFYIARQAYKAGLVTKSDIEIMTCKKRSRANERSFYRVMDALENNRDTTKKIIWEN